MALQMCKELFTSKTNYCGAKRLRTTNRPRLHGLRYYPSWNYLTGICCKHNKNLTLVIYGITHKHTPRWVRWRHISTTKLCPAEPGTPGCPGGCLLPVLPSLAAALPQLTWLHSSCCPQLSPTLSSTPGEGFLQPSLHPGKQQPVTDTEKIITKRWQGAQHACWEQHPQRIWVLTHTVLQNTYTHFLFKGFYLSSLVLWRNKQRWKSPLPFPSPHNKFQVPIPRHGKIWNELNYKVSVVLVFVPQMGTKDFSTSACFRK